MTVGDDQAIQDLIAARAASVNVADLDTIMEPMADDVVSFDVIGKLRVVGKASVWENASAWLGFYNGPPHWEDRDVVVSAGGDVAFAHMLSHVTGHRQDGVDVDMWFRTTLGLHRMEDQWRIVHEHQSEPFDVESGLASLDLKP